MRRKRKGEDVREQKRSEGGTRQWDGRGCKQRRGGSNKTKGDEEKDTIREQKSTEDKKN